MALEIERLCAHMVMVGFPGPELDPDLAALIDRGVFGAILFRRNLGNPEQTAALCARLKSRAGRPFMLAVDQEGGRVARLRGAPFTPLPPMRVVGERGDAAFAERAGRLLAFELSAVGFDLDFAPVLDVDTQPANPVIGDRAFARSAEEVSRLGVALAKGLEAGGVASCGKHFPGHGDTLQDSHLALPKLPHALERLRRVELPPFAAYARARLASIMTAHVVFEAVEASVPATLSERVITGILRGELGFEGVVVSDDLEMRAIADLLPVEEAVVRGARAGVDLFLVCHHAEMQNRAIDALVRAVESGALPRERVLEANRRLDVLEKRFFRPPGDRLHLLGGSEHRALAEGLAGEGAGTDPTERA